jgi:hypothetical protein
VLPPDAAGDEAATGEFVWKMEDVLDVYERPYDPKRPVVCLDETTKQLVAEIRTPLPPVPARDGRPGRPTRVDYESERRGVSSLFLVCEPLRGWRHVAVSERRTKRDWARIIKELVDVHYPDADTIVLVQDNLNTHTPAALYETFPPAEARRLARKLELHFTPKHGSWLNVAEIELAVLTRQCLDTRIPDPQTLAERVTAWFASRNARRGPVRWRFTTAGARIKLHRLYPLLPA